MTYGLPELLTHITTELGHLIFFKNTFPIKFMPTLTLLSTCIVKLTFCTENTKVPVIAVVVVVVVLSGREISPELPPMQRQLFGPRPDPASPEVHPSEEATCQAEVCPALALGEVSRV